jgi:hypothetical protein
MGFCANFEKNFSLKTFSMKKTILFIVLALGVATVNAQDITSKKGEKYLPESGDWSIGIDAAPVLTYLGNFFGKTESNNSPTWNFPNIPLAIQGKYMVDDKTAYRVGVRIGLSSSSQTNTVTDRSVDNSTIVFPAVPPTVDNKWAQTSTNIALTAGLEKRLGKTRLQGFYGAEAAITYMSSGDKFTYGNALNPTATIPVVINTTDDAFAGANNITTDTYEHTARVTKTKSGGSFGIGVRGFVGAEYFILPKISISGEFGWGLGIDIDGKSSVTTESIGAVGATQVVGTQTINGSKGGSVSLDTNNANTIFGASGDLRLSFYFQ